MPRLHRSWVLNQSAQHQCNTEMLARQCFLGHCLASWWLVPAFPLLRLSSLMLTAPFCFQASWGFFPISQISSPVPCSSSLSFPRTLSTPLITTLVSVHCTSAGPRCAAKDWAASAVPKSPGEELSRDWLYFSWPCLCRCGQVYLVTTND